MKITFDENEIARIVAEYATRELDHEITADDVMIDIENPESDERTVTVSYEIEQFEADGD